MRKDLNIISNSQLFPLFHTSFENSNRNIKTTTLSYLDTCGKSLSYLFYPFHSLGDKFLFLLKNTLHLTEQNIIDILNPLCNETPSIIPQ